MKFDICKDAQNEFRWRLWADDDRIIAESRQGHKSKGHCREEVSLVRSSADAEIIDDTPLMDHRVKDPEQVAWGRPRPNIQPKSVTG